MSNQTPHPHSPPAPAASENSSLIEYPCNFPIKVMGVKVPHLIDTLCAEVLNHAPDWSPSELEIRESKTGKYQSLTMTIPVKSRQQLDDIYRTLSAHPLVKVVL